MYPGNQESKLHFGDVSNTAEKPVSQDNSPTTFSTDTASPQHVQFWTSQYKKNTKVLESFQRRVTELVKAWQGMSYEERQRTSCISSLKNKRLIGDLIALCSSLRKGNAEEEVSFFSLEPVTEHTGLAQSCVRGGSDWMLGKMYLLCKWLNTGTAS